MNKLIITQEQPLKTLPSQISFDRWKGVILSFWFSMLYWIMSVVFVTAGQYEACSAAFLPKEEKNGDNPAWW